MTIPESDRYKFIGLLRNSQDVSKALNSLSSEEIKQKTFQFLIKQYKGNSKQLIEVLGGIDFTVTIPKNLQVLTLNSLNSLNLDCLINMQSKVENHEQLKFKINELYDSRYIEYSFREISAIIAKIEEITADIPEEMDESNKFYTLYSRLTNMMVYDYKCIRDSEGKFGNSLKKVRKKAAGLYGGLLDGKSICAGYALILHEALQYIGMKSQLVGGRNFESAHAWNQVQIDGKWYNTDPTWDSSTIQMCGQYKYMLQNDKIFDITHGKFFRRDKTYKQCTSNFDYSKIKGLNPRQVSIERSAENCVQL